MIELFQCILESRLCLNLHGYKRTHNHSSPGDRPGHDKPPLAPALTFQGRMHIYHNYLTSPSVCFPIKMRIIKLVSHGVSAKSAFINRRKYKNGSHPASYQSVCVWLTKLLACSPGLCLPPESCPTQHLTCMGRWWNFIFQRIWIPYFSHESAICWP